MTLPTPWGVRCFDRVRALRFLNAVEALWRENIDPQQDEAFKRAKSQILRGRAERNLPEKPQNLALMQIVARYYRLFAAAGFSFGHSAARALPKDSIYLNVGQLQIFRPWFWWLQRRRDIKSVFMIHDVTPIEHPSHHLPIVVSLHHRIVRNTAEVVTALIFPSNAAQNSVVAEVRKHGARNIASHVELLPVPDEFLGDVLVDGELSKIPYFIICGVIDPHKNHLFLLEIWKELITRLGSHAPQLVIAGSPQVAGEAVYNTLKADPELHRHVVIAPGVSTPGLRQLMRGAKALLMPSISEGFGLPIVEALAQGTPVIASDIPAHREAGRGGEVLYLSLEDRFSWVRSIEALVGEPARGKSAAQHRYEPKTWEHYFSRIETFLAQLK